jgi:hypothetical protein
MMRSACFLSQAMRIHRPLRTAVRDRSCSHGRLGVPGVLAAWAPPGCCGRARRSVPLGGGWLPGGTGDIGGDDVGGVPVETSAGSVVADGGPWIGVRGGFLDIAERDPGVQRSGDERVPQRVRPYRLSG